MLSLVIASALVSKRDEYQRSANDHSLESLPLGFDPVREPHCETGGQDAPHGRAVEGHHQHLTDVIFPEHPQEMQTLLCCLDESGDVVCKPGKVSRLESVDPLHAVTML